MNTLRKFALLLVAAAVGYSPPAKAQAALTGVAVIGGACLFLHCQDVFDRIFHPMEEVKLQDGSIARCDLKKQYRGGKKRGFYHCLDEDDQHIAVRILRPRRAPVPVPQPSVAQYQPPPQLPQASGPCNINIPDPASGQYRSFHLTPAGRLEPCQWYGM